MTGDIVERLGQDRDYVLFTAADGMPGLRLMSEADRRHEAADEIVRLRAEVERLRAAGDALAEVSLGARPWITPLFAMEHGDRISAATAAWQEARRER